MGYRKGYFRKDGTYVNGHFTRTRSKMKYNNNNKGCLIIFVLFIPFVFILSCNYPSPKEVYTELLKERIGDRLPFDEVKIAKVEGGTAIIIDKFNCYWVDSNNKIYCVNGASKSTLRDRFSQEEMCEDAPIKSTYSEINLVAE